jgi:hypothetical protein
MSSFIETSHDFNYQHTFAPFAQGEDLPLADILSNADVERILAEENVTFGETSRSLWTPAITLATLLWQMLCPDPSCRQAVAHIFLCLALVRDPVELDTAGYCRARAKLPASALKRVALLIGQRLEAAALPDWQWHNRTVKMVDGSTSQLPDTEANQQAFPQQSQQKQGLGFPLIRWVVLIGLATASIQEFAYGPYAGKETGETALFRQMLEALEEGDIVLADRFYCSYFVIAMLQMRGVDVVARLHQKRKYDFRLGEQLGQGDHIVLWQKPDRPEWMDEELYALLPDTLRMREIYCTVNQRGYRVQALVIATTLLDVAEYPAADIAALYAKRWTVELDIRALKITLRMDCLRCQTPFMVEKEIWAHLLAYNLVRKVGAQVAKIMEVTPRSISFTATKQAILGGWQQALQLQGVEYVRVAKAMLKMLRTEQVGHRPGRCEPRAVKRRPKAHKLLREPRQEARAKLLQDKPKLEKAGPKDG